MPRRHLRRGAASTGGALKSVVVSWVPSLLDAAGNPVTLTGAQIRFDLISRSPGLGYAFIVNVGDGVSTSKTISNLLPSTQYFFVVIEQDAAGNSYPSQESTFTTAP